MSGLEWAALAEVLRRGLASEGVLHFPDDGALMRSSVLLNEGRSVFLLAQECGVWKLFGVVRYAKDLPETFPGEHLRLARCGMAVVAERGHETAGALKSLLQLPSPMRLSGGGAESVLLCRCGIAGSREEDAATLLPAGLTPCWTGGTADEAFWSAFASGWRQPFFRCRELMKMTHGGLSDAALTAAYGGRCFVLNDGSALKMPQAICGTLPEGLRRGEAVAVQTAAELLILAREAKKSGGALGLVLVESGGPEEEKRCRSVAESCAVGHVVCAPERFAALRQTGERGIGCDWKEDSFAEAAKKIRNVVQMTVK